ncbi:unnamed protein product, partial [Leptidea sinapis]
NSNTISICAAYIPSPLKYYTLLRFVLNVETILVNKQLQTVVIGDFNISSIKWNSVEDYNNDPAAVLINDFMALINLSQFNGKSNAYGKILDLVFSTLNNITVENSDFSACSIDKYHPLLEINIEIYYKDSLFISNVIVKHNFRNAEY